MAKNIVILNGSPRRKGNTAGLVQAFTEGAEANGNQVTTFFLDGMNINGCKGCLGGKGTEEHPCIQRDDMDQIYAAMREAEVVVLASPLYWWSFSGQLRTAVDRLFALAEGGGTGLAGKSCALLMAAQGNTYDDIASHYEKVAKRIGWNNIGMVLASGVAVVGDIEGSAFLDDARQLGASIQ